MRLLNLGAVYLTVDILYFIQKRIWGKQQSGMASYLMTNHMAYVHDEKNIQERK